MGKIEFNIKKSRLVFNVFILILFAIFGISYLIHLLNSPPSTYWFVYFSIAILFSILCLLISWLVFRKIKGSEPGLTLNDEFLFDNTPSMGIGEI